MKSALYSSPLRPLPEMNAIRLWLAIMALALASLAVYGSYWPPVAVIVIAGATSAWMSWSRIAPLHKLQRGLVDIDPMFMTTKELRKKMDAHPGMVWLGRGFSWRQRHAQLYDELSGEHYDHLDHVTRCLRDGTALAKGAMFVHGVGMPEESDVFIPADHQAGHTLVTGTTGSGKTRLLDVLATQCIFRNETVVVFDPKGDKDLADSLRRSCEDMGDPERFVYFHPAFPNSSALIDPLRNFNRETELASRISSLIKSDGDVFKDFAWMALNKIASGMLMIESSPDLVSLKRWLEMGADKMLVEVLERHLDKLDTSWRVKMSAKGKADRYLANLIELYQGQDSEHHDSDIDGLISMVTHDREHFGKMVANLLPIMTMLTSGSLRDLLSPSRAPVGDTRVSTDIGTILSERKVLYIALDSLSDAVVSSAIGSMLLSDLASVAGDLYNRTGQDKPPAVNVFIDEAAEVLNDPTIQLLNKGRGAGMRLTLLTQTCADLEARLQSAAKARQVLGNLNNQIILRTLDGASQKYLAENMPETVLYGIERSQSNTSGTAAPTTFSGSFSERTSETKAPLVTSQVMGLTPDLHCFAKVSGSLFFKLRIPILTGNSPS